MQTLSNRLRWIRLKLPYTVHCVVGLIHCDSHDGQPCRPAGTFPPKIKNLMVESDGRNLNVAHGGRARPPSDSYVWILKMKNLSNTFTAMR